MEDEVFIHIAKSIDTNISGFVKIWNTELPCIFTKMKTNFYSEVSGIPFTESTPNRFVRDDDSNYLMKTETEFIKVSSVKKLIKLLDDHSQELTEFAKEEKISGRSGAEMAKILDYYHTLEHDL